MKRSLIFCGLLTVLAICFVSCRNKSNEITINGIWNLSRSEYYFDGNKLDYDASVIGICDSAAIRPVLMYPYEVTWNFNKDGKGQFSGHDSTSVSFTYTLNGNQINISFGEEEEQPGYKTSVTSLFFFENGRIRISDTFTDIHGWAKVSNREEVFGLDGQKNHKLEAVHYYDKLLKE